MDPRNSPGADSIIVVGQLAIHTWPAANLGKRSSIFQLPVLDIEQLMCKRVMASPRSFSILFQPANLMILLPRIASQVVSNNRSWFYPWNSVSVISFEEREREKSLPGEEWRKLVKSRWLEEEEEALVKVVLVSHSPRPANYCRGSRASTKCTPPSRCPWFSSFRRKEHEPKEHERSPILFSTKAFLPPSRPIVSNDSTSKDSILSKFAIVRPDLNEFNRTITVTLINFYQKGSNW